jgi:hypothetical protein
MVRVVRRPGEEVTVRLDGTRLEMDGAIHEPACRMGEGR